MSIGLFITINHILESMAILLGFGLDVFSIVTSMKTRSLRMLPHKRKKRRLTRKRLRKPSQET